MNEIVKGIIRGVVIAISLWICGCNITQWQWWVAAIILNVISAI
jgi:hypothetical protein